MNAKIVLAGVGSLVSAGLFLGSSQPVEAQSGCNDGKNRRVTMVNDTSFDIIRLYGSNIGETSWQEDVLGSDILPRGRTVVVNWDDGTCYCNFDFKAEFSDNTTTIKNGVNVCTIASFRFHD